ncbi:MAG: OmpA family protein [Candidatus Kapaibacteriota bacterium]
MKVLLSLLVFVYASVLNAADTTVIKQQVLWKAGGSVFPSLYRHLVDFSALPGIPSCATTYSNAQGFLGSLGLDFIYDFETMPLSLQSRLDIKGIPGAFYESEEILIDDTNVTPSYTMAKIGYNLSTSLYSLGLSLLANYRLDDRLSVGAGLRFGGIVSSGFDQWEKLETPNNAVFIPENTRIRNEFSGPIPFISTMEGGMVFNARYALPLNQQNTTQLIPEIAYEFPITDLLSTAETWQVHTMRLGVSVVFSYTKEESIIIPLETKDPIIIPSIAISNPTRNQVEMKQNLTSLIQSPIKAILYDTNGRQVDNVINIEKKVARNMFSIINYVFFDSSSAEIPTRYKKLTENERENFSIEDIRTDSAINLYHNVLNILGQRLQKKPNADISLTGTNSNNGSETNNIALSRKRAESIKNYLVNVWNIDPSRINLDAKNLPDQPSRINTGYGEEENRRVEISSNDPDMFLPVKFIDTSYKVIPNDIRISTDRLNKENLKSWELRAVTGNQYVVLKTGDSFMDDTLRTFAENISDDLLSSESVELKIIAKDNNGSEKIIGETSVPVKQIIANKSKVEKYNLITFGYNSSAVDEANNFIIQDVKKNILNTSILTLTGHTDRTGAAQYNRSLSLRRAQEISRFFTANKIVTEGRGFDDLLFPLNLPEGRFYSRTVRITVDTYLDEEKK